MAKRLTEEQKKNRKKGVMRVQGEQLKKYRDTHNKKLLEQKLIELRKEFKNK